MVYSLRDGSGKERYQARVLAPGLWVKKLSDRPGTGVRSGGFEIMIRRTEREDEGAHPGKVGTSRVGYLVLMTSGGAVMGHDREIKALRTFELPEIPQSPKAADMALASIQAAGKTAGLILNVRESKDLVEITGERQ